MRTIFTIWRFFVSCAHFLLWMYIVITFCVCTYPSVCHCSDFEDGVFLPARASEQGNVIGLVSVYIYIYIYICHQKKIVIERTRDLIYLKFVATDFSPKIISPSAGENSGDSA